ncbi:hypothetical protein BJ875DRAFT_2878 [Amylocarpus encephaloides]|uniref:Uncharacterized protein n=1 Tax=Amylocarpus encephaloides TaxID=45428 RepID=A0A9P8CAR1_9HELO|nr:hypothetical protein BJ875DRAFT_2878 [Amylocarpus encephaloides]
MALGENIQARMAMQGKGIVSALLVYIKGAMDRVVKPETRRDVYNTLHDFANDRPVLASLLLALTLLSLTPLLLFTTFAISVLLFAFTFSVFFSVFWIGLASFLLVPTLLVCVGLGVCVWMWGLGTWILGMWVRRLVVGRMT